MTYISRDPFARTELHRIELTPYFRKCDWCGGKNARGNLFAYRVESDGGRKEYVKGEFCCVGCMRSYHGAAEKKFAHCEKVA